MPHMKVEDVYVDFPVMRAEAQSLKKAIVASATGGRIVTGARDIPVVRALSGVTFELKPGERVGLIGRNGAGKTTLLRTLAGVYEPIRGSITSQGRIVSMLDAGLQPEMTGYENIQLRGLLLGLSKPELRAMTAEVETFSELGEFLSMPVRVYSSGMTMRLAFAMATIGRPEILLMDEWVLAGDAQFMLKAKTRMQKFVAEAQIMVLASHSENLIRQNCSRAIYLDKGEIVADGPVEDVIKQYRTAA
jgi:ABC-type polysaccharide/polyol phosphate transport system ATPase subunit